MDRSYSYSRRLARRMQLRKCLAGVAALGLASCAILYAATAPVPVAAPAAPIPAGAAPAEDGVAANDADANDEDEAADAGAAPDKQDMDAPADTGADTDSALAGDPEAAPGERVAEVNETEDNAVVMTTGAVDEADPEHEAEADTAGRSQDDE